MAWKEAWARREKLYAAQEKPIAKGAKQRGNFHRTWCLVRQVPPGEAYGAHQDLLHPCQHPQARVCDEQQHWKELTYLYIQYDEFDNAATTIMNYSPDAWDHMQFKNVA